MLSPHGLDIKTPLLCFIILGPRLRSPPMRDCDGQVPSFTEKTPGWLTESSPGRRGCGRFDYKVVIGHLEELQVVFPMKDGMLYEPDE